MNDEHVTHPTLPEPDVRALKRAAWIFGALLVALFVIGWLPRFLGDRRNRRDIAALQQSAPLVGTVKPRRAPDAGTLTLPGNAKAFEETALFPRVSGYLKRRLADIGDHVTKDQLLAEIDAPEIDAQLNQAKAGVVRAESDLALARSTLARYEGFAKSGGVTRQVLDERQGAAHQAEAALAAAEAEVQRLSDLQAFERISAPFSGTVTARNYDSGALLSASSTVPIFMLQRADIIRVYAAVPQSFSGDVHAGQPASFSVSNYPGRTFAGEVARTAAAIDPATRTLYTEVDVPNADGALLPGMYGQVAFVLTREAPLLVPTSAVIFDAQGTRIATVQDGKTHFIPVTLGRDFGVDIEALQGVRGDEDIITTPGQTIIEGRPVEMRPAEEPKKQ